LSWRSSLRRELKMMPSAAGPTVRTTPCSRPAAELTSRARVAVTGQVAQQVEQLGVSGGLASPVGPGGQAGCLLHAGVQGVQVLRGHLPAGDVRGGRQHRDHRVFPS